MKIWYVYEFNDGKGGILRFRRLLNWPLNENEEEDVLKQLRQEHDIPVLADHLPMFRTDGAPF